MSDDEIRAATLKVVGSYQTLMREGSWDDWGRLWAEDGVLEFPYAPEGKPRRYVGRDAIVAYMRSAAGMFTIKEVTSRRLHTMTDPRVAAVELSIMATMNGNGAPYDQRYVVFFEVEGGEIRQYREYWDPLTTQNAYGGLDAWLSAYPQGGEAGR